MPLVVAGLAAVFDEILQRDAGIADELSVTTTNSTPPGFKKRTILMTWRKRL